MCLAAHQDVEAFVFGSKILRNRALFIALDATNIAYFLLACHFCTYLGTRANKRPKGRPGCTRLL